MTTTPVRVEALTERCDMFDSVRHSEPCSPTDDMSSHLCVAGVVAHVPGRARDTWLKDFGVTGNCFGSNRGISVCTSHIPVSPKHCTEGGANVLRDATPSVGGEAGASEVCPIFGKGPPKEYQRFGQCNCMSVIARLSSRPKKSSLALP